MHDLVTRGRAAVSERRYDDAAKALDEAACFRVGGELERAAGFVAKADKWW